MGVTLADFYRAATAPGVSDDKTIYATKAGVSTHSRLGFLRRFFCRSDREAEYLQANNIFAKALRDENRVLCPGEDIPLVTSTSAKDAVPLTAGAIKRCYEMAQKNKVRVFLDKHPHPSGVTAEKALAFATKHNLPIETTADIRKLIARVHASNTAVKVHVALTHSCGRAVKRDDAIALVESLPAWKAVMDNPAVWDRDDFATTDEFKALQKDIDYTTRMLEHIPLASLPGCKGHPQSYMDAFVHAQAAFAKGLLDSEEAAECYMHILKTLPGTRSAAELDAAVSNFCVAKLGKEQIGALAVACVPELSEIDAGDLSWMLEDPRFSKALADEMQRQGPTLDKATLEARFKTVATAFLEENKALLVALCTMAKTYVPLKGEASFAQLLPHLMKMKPLLDTLMRGKSFSFMHEEIAATLKSLMATFGTGQNPTRRRMIDQCLRFFVAGQPKDGSKTMLSGMVLMYATTDFMKLRTGLEHLAHALEGGLLGSREDTADAAKSVHAMVDFMRTLGEALHDAAQKANPDDERLQSTEVRANLFSLPVQSPPDVHAFSPLVQDVAADLGVDRRLMRTPEQVRAHALAAEYAGTPESPRTTPKLAQLLSGMVGEREWPTPFHLHSIPPGEIGGRIFAALAREGENLTEEKVEEVVRAAIADYLDEVHEALDFAPEASLHEWPDGMADVIVRNGLRDKQDITELVTLARSWAQTTHNLIEDPDPQAHFTMFVSMGRKISALHRAYPGQPGKVRALATAAMELAFADNGFGTARLKAYAFHDTFPGPQNRAAFEQLNALIELAEDIEDPAQRAETLGALADCKLAALGLLNAACTTIGKEIPADMSVIGARGDVQASTFTRIDLTLDMHPEVFECSKILANVRPPLSAQDKARLLPLFTNLSARLHGSVRTAFLNQLAANAPAFIAKMNAQPLVPGQPGQRQPLTNSDIRRVLFGRAMPGSSSYATMSTANFGVAMMRHAVAAVISHRGTRSDTRLSRAEAVDIVGAGVPFSRLLPCLEMGRTVPLSSIVLADKMPSPALLPCRPLTQAEQSALAQTQDPAEQALVRRQPQKEAVRDTLKFLYDHGVSEERSLGLVVDGELLPMASPRDYWGDEYEADAPDFQTGISGSTLAVIEDLGTPAQVDGILRCMPQHVLPQLCSLASTFGNGTFSCYTGPVTVSMERQQDGSVEVRLRNMVTDTRHLPRNFTCLEFDLRYNVAADGTVTTTDGAFRPYSDFQRMLRQNMGEEYDF